MMERYWPGQNLRMERVTACGTMMAFLVLLPDSSVEELEYHRRRNLPREWWQVDHLLFGIGSGKSAPEVWSKAIRCARRGALASCRLTVYFIEDGERRKYRICSRSPRDKDGRPQSLEPVMVFSGL